MEAETGGFKPFNRDCIHLSLLHIHPENSSPEFELIWYPHTPPYEYSMVTAIRGSISENYQRNGDELLICIVHSPGDVEILRSTFGPFPPSLLHYLSSQSAFSPGSSTVPEWNQDRGLSFVHKYVQLKPQEETKANAASRLQMYPLLKNEVCSSTLASWVGASFGIEDRKIPMILLFGEVTYSDVLLLQAHYQKLQRRQRLLACREWFYHDLNSVFSHWRLTWAAAIEELKDRSIEVNLGIWTVNVLQRMRKLNRAMATNIFMRESLHIESSSMKEICESATEIYTTFHGIVTDQAQVDFISRCRSVGKAIDHDLLLAQGILALARQTWA